MSPDFAAYKFNKKKQKSILLQFKLDKKNSAKSGDVCGAFHRIFVLNTLLSRGLVPSMAMVLPEIKSTSFK
ncbi:MAG: hypothetical protein ACOVQR_10575, partial [Flavobacterium sp.]